MNIPSMLRTASVLALSASFAAAAADFNPTPEDRKSNRPVELWRTYMHGVVDDFAKPLTVRFDKVKAVDAVIDTPRVKAEVKAFEVGKGKSYLSATLPLDVKQFRGRKIRFFYWMRGFETGSKPVVNSYHDAPQLYVIYKDDKDKTLIKLISHNGAVGTYPWHCYYLDAHVPPTASRARIVIENLHDGRAEFARFGYEPVTDANTYTQNEKQDPDTGSIAAFPWYEPINFHFFAKPPATKYVWNFMRGPAAGMIGQPYDLTKIDGLKRYFHESVKTDLDQMNHGIMYFPARYALAKEKKVLPPMPENWLEEIGKLIIADQDPKTGFWGTNAIPQSMSVSFHYVDMLFAHGIDRFDRPAVSDPKRCLAPEIPHAAEMARSTLKLQSTIDGRLAAWNAAAYNFTDDPNRSRSGCQLGSTMNAIRLLRMCRRFVEPSLKAEIDRSVEAAFRYALTTVIMPDGTFKQQDVDANPTKSAYWPNIVECSAYLEKRTDASFAAPKLERTGDGVRCAEWPERLNSVRIYAAEKPDGLEPGQIVGIISRGDAAVIELDPYLATRKMMAAARAAWGERSFKMPDRMKPLTKNVATAIKDGALTLPKGKKLYATAVDWYGVESAPVEIK